MRRSHVGFDFAPALLDDVELTPDPERLVGIPHVIDEHDRAEPAQHHHADLERVALPLPLFLEFLVKEIEVECHVRA